MSRLAIVNGLLADGSGAPLRPADVVVEDGAIVAVGDRAGDAERVIDAAGRVVAPGFVDIHTHSDVTLLADRRGLSKLAQGVTLEVVGNCGMSPAPITPEVAERVRDAVSYIDAGLPWDWRSFGDFARRLGGCSLNVAAMVGHIALRAAIMGFERRPPTAAELKRMKALLADCFEAGAVGFTSGLIYAPSSYADVAELAALCEVVAAHDGVYMTHMRAESHDLVGSVAEAIETARRSGCRLQISHLKAAGREVWGTMPDAIALIDAALADGVDVAMDTYPYTAGATQLSALLPPWVHEGGSDRLLERVRDPEARRTIQAQVADPPPDWQGYRLEIDDDFAIRTITHVGVSDNQWMVGRSLLDIGQAIGLQGYDIICEILARDEARTGFVAFHLREEDLRLALTHPRCAVASDGLAIAPDGPLGEGRPHPRCYGTFPRVLGRYVRELGWLTLPEAVHKMTRLPALRVGQRDRGLVEPGMKADLVVFDPATVGDRATFENPHQLPVGLDVVVVNGEIALAAQEATAARAGKWVTLG